jgi:ankyrin repeat protein
LPTLAGISVETLIITDTRGTDIMFKNYQEFAHKEIIVSFQRYKAKFEKDPSKVIKAIAAHKKALFVIEDNDVLRCSDVYYSLCKHAYIKELQLRNKIVGESLEALCALMDENSTIQKIQIDKQVLPHNHGSLGQRLDYLSACLALNIRMQSESHAGLIEEAATEIFLDSPRLLLFPSYCQALLRHPVASKVIAKDGLTLAQLLSLNNVLAANTHIVSVVINGINAIEEPIKKPNQVIKHFISNDKVSVKTETKALRAHLALNWGCAEIRAGNKDSLCIVEKLSDAQKAAVIGCLQLGNAVKMLQLPEVDEAILQAIPIEGSLVELRIACRLDKEAAAKQRSILNAFLRTNLSVLEVVGKDSNDRLNERLLVNSYNYKVSCRHLQFNNFLRSLKADNGRVVKIEELSVSDDKVGFIARRLEAFTDLAVFSIQQCSLSEFAFFEIISALARNPANKLSSLLLCDVEMSPRIFDQVVNIIKRQPYLTRLQLVKVGLSDGEIPRLAELLRINLPLTLFNVAGNKIGNQGITTLCGALETNRRVSTLYLGGNSFDSTGIAAVKRLLAQTAYITTVFLESSNLREADIKPFIDAINANTSIVELRLSHHTEKNTYHPNGFNAPPLITPYKKNTMDRIEKFITKNTTKRDDLFIDVRQGKVQQVSKAFDYKVSPLCTDGDGNTALHVAVTQDPPNMPLVECLLKRGSHLLLVNKQGKSAVAMLNESSPPELRQLLQTALRNFLENRDVLEGVERAEETQSKKQKAQPAVAAAPVAKVNTLDKFFGAPKKRSAQEEPESAMGEQCLSPESKQAKVSPASPKILSPATPLRQNLADLPNVINSAYFAALNNNITLLRRCLAHMDPAQVYPDGNTLWHLAASKNALDCLHVLYANKHTASIPNQLRQLPLHLACLNITSDIAIEAVELLISAHAEAVSAVDIFGQTPLFYLAGGFELQPNLVATDPYRALIAKKLLEHSADPNILCDDLLHQRKHCSVLQKAIAGGFYRLAKVLLASPHTNLAHVDAEGWSVLHYAVHYGQTPLLARLLIQPQVNPDLTNRVGKSARQMLRDGEFSPTVMGRQQLKEQMETLFESRARQRIPSIASEVYWVKSLVIHYGNRFGRGHHLQLSFNEDHALLQKGIQPHLQKQGNLLSACLTFIVSKGAHQPGANLPRVAIKVDLTFTPKFHATDGWQSAASIERPSNVSAFKKFIRSPDALGRIIERFDAAPEDIKSLAVDDVNQHQRPLTKAAIEGLFKSSDDSAAEYGFEQHFHHTEHALFDHLQQLDVIRKIIQELRSNPLFTEHCKVLAVALNGFTKNYVCPDCVVSTMGFQNTQEGEFFKLLKAELAGIGCALPRKSDLRAITLFSAQQPYHQARKSADEHEDVVIDLRAYPNNKILTQDTTAIQSSATLFTSRKNY